MRIPAASRAMGRSIAGKAPSGNQNRNSRGRIKPNTRTPTKEERYKREVRQLQIEEKRQIKKSNTRGQQVIQQRPGAMHARWGNPAEMSGKGHGQDHIIGYATAAGITACLLLISAAGLNSLNDNRDKEQGVLLNVEGAALLSVWLYVKVASTGLTSGVACCLRSYWVCSNYNGSSKLKSYVVLMVSDFLYGGLVLVLMMLNFVGHFFWWLGFLVLLLFSAGGLRTLFDILFALDRKNKEKQNDQTQKEKIDTQLTQDNQIDLNQIQKKNKDDKIEIVVTAESNDATPSAPPFTDLNEIPYAPASPVRSDRMMYPNGQKDRTNEPLKEHVRGGGFVMDQRSFEQKWLRLPQLSSRNDTFLPPMPGIGDIKLHMMERNFNIVASGTIEGVTRIYMHCLVSSENYLLVEVVISEGVDASAQCTLTTTIKIDASGMGDPNLSRIVDSMELSLLFRI